MTTGNACTVAVDLGGTHVRAALVADDGSILTADRRPTPRNEPTPTVIPTMVKELLALVPDGIDAPGRAVIAVPGIIDHEGGRLLAAPNIPTTWPASLHEAWLADRTGLEVSLANDADLAAVGESTFGAGRDHRDVVYVTISTGVGAGVVVAGQLVRGRLSGGELGHTVIDRAAAATGGPCTVEDLGSGTAINRAAVEAGIESQGPELAELVRQQDPAATAVWTEAIEAVGIGIANMAWVVAPQVVVVGGGVGSNGDLVLPILRRQIDRHGPETGGSIEVVTAMLGDGAALSGAAAWWTAVGRG
ncbi:MAG: ROK family protein [Actinomycetota bacterium]